MNKDLKVVTHEQGFGPEPLPTWTNTANKLNLFDAQAPSNISRVDIPEVAGAFQLLNILSSEEADKIVALAESMGFHKDSPVSLPRNIRHNDSLNWVVSEDIDSEIWRRAAPFINEQVGAESAKGINARFRFYRYQTGDFFKPHIDGAWPGSRVIDGELVNDAYPNVFSQFTFLILLNGDYEGGHTQFMVSKSDPTKPAKRQDDIQVVKVKTPKGGVLCFPHGHHPLNCLHESETISAGTKYIIRSDILFGQ